jgi:hypothetical protein
MPIAWIRCRKTGPYEVSRSRMRSRGAWSHGNASVTWREIHSAVGFAVTPNDTQSRRPWRTMTRQYRIWAAFYAHDATGSCSNVSFRKSDTRSEWPHCLAWSDTLAAWRIDLDQTFGGPVGRTNCSAPHEPTISRSRQSHGQTPRAEFFGAPLKALSQLWRADSLRIPHRPAAAVYLR